LGFRGFAVRAGVYLLYPMTRQLKMANEKLQVIDDTVRVEG
jgi:hypothetical protein